MDRIKVGVIGVGFMGRNHALAYKKIPEAELVGVADVDSERSRAVADEAGVQSYTDSHDLLVESGAQAVSICTNDQFHVEPSLAAFHAGSHVLLEKPIATTLEDADRILEAAEEAGRCFLVGHILRFEPRYLEAKNAVDSGEIGDVISVYARRLNHQGAQDVLKGRVSVLSFLGVHDFDVCQWLTGSRASRVYCESADGLLRSRGYNVEDQTFTTIRFDGGAVACVEAGWALPNTHPRQADFALEVIGTKGVINLELMSSGISLCGQDGLRYPRLGDALEKQLEHFVHCIRGLESPAITGQEARHAMEISLAAQESAKNCLPVEL